MAIKKLESSEMCPVCKSSKYLNPKMIFKVNPECYHKMCDSCVDRIFSQGPGPCPVAGCGKTLRKNRFKIPRFEDLAIERECDIRARIAKILNHREEDFENLRSYNDYLEWKEDIVFKLVSRIDVAKTEELLQKYAQDQAASISANATLESSEADAVREHERMRKERSTLAREEALREVQEEKQERENSRRDLMDHISRPNEHSSASKAAKEAERTVLKKSSQKRAGAGAGKAQDEQPPAAQASGQGTASSGNGFGFLNLKKTEVRGPERPYDPFGGLLLSTEYYTFSADGGYHHPWSNAVDEDQRHSASGYQARDYQKRALLEAHAGLGVMIAVEKG